MGYTVAVVGATGAVGAQMIKMLEESTLPIDKIRYLASARSAGKVLQFKGQDVTIDNFNSFITTQAMKYFSQTTSILIIDDFSSILRGEHNVIEQCHFVCDKL